MPPRGADDDNRGIDAGHENAEAKLGEGKYSGDGDANAIVSGSNGDGNGRESERVAAPLPTGNVFDILSDRAASANDADGASAGKKARHQQVSVYFLGGASSGKNTVSANFLHPSKPFTPKPSVALEYAYGRRARPGTIAVKDVVHVYELAGGTRMRNLLEISLSSERMVASPIVFCVTVDLSKPADAFAGLIEWLEHLVATMDGLVSSLPDDDAAFVRSRADSRRAECVAVADRDRIRRCDADIVIVGAKCDKLRDEDMAKCRLLCGAMRYAAHAYGASLVFTSSASKSSMSAMRSLLNHLAFGTDRKDGVKRDPAKPLYVPAGRDSLESIGAPPGARREDFVSDDAQPLASDSYIAMWLNALDEYFPSSSLQEETKSNSNTNDLNLSSEPVVDAMWAQKADELKKYQAEADRRRQLNAKAATPRR